MNERKYFPINEESARQAHEMMSFSDYKAGSLTAEYRSYVNAAYDIADQIAEEKPEDADRVYAIAERYSKRMAENLNKRSHIGCMCPSVLISGAGNFPVRKKEKQNAAVDKNHQEWNEIQKLLERMKGVQNGKDIIKSGDADAVKKLEKKLEGLKDLQDKMKTVNAYYRKNKTVEGCPGLTTKEISEIKFSMSRDFHYEDKPFLSWQLSNNNAEIHRIEGRLKKLKAAKEKGTEERENEHFKVVENTEIMRLQLFFEGKPDEETRMILKKNGFRWSPKNSCWQRQLTENAKYSLKKILEEMGED